MTHTYLIVCGFWFCKTTEKLLSMKPVRIKCLNNSRGGGVQHIKCQTFQLIEKRVQVLFYYLTVWLRKWNFSSSSTFSTLSLFCWTDWVYIKGMACTFLLRSLHLILRRAECGKDTTQYSARPRDCSIGVILLLLKIDLWIRATIPYGSPWCPHQFSWGAWNS